MSWFLRLAPVIMVCACGGTTITREGDAGASGNRATGGDVGAGGDVGNGGTVGSGGWLDTGSTVRSGGVVGSGGTTGTGGHIWTGGTVGSGGLMGTGGTMTHVPLNHRPTAVACGTPPEGDASAPLGQSPPYQMCTTNAECTSGVNGRCIPSRGGSLCAYDACFVDSDCAKGSVCACGSPTGQGNRCLEPGCRVDADCPGSFCSPSPTFGPCGNYVGVQEYQCHTPKDECVNDSECTGMPNNFGAYCAYDPNVGHWACSYQNCAG